MPSSPNKLSQFWQELVRRKVIHFLIGYMTASFAIIEFVLNASETFSVSQETIKLLYLLSAIGIPVVILLPWYINQKKAVIKTNESGDREFNTRSDKPPVQKNQLLFFRLKTSAPILIRSISVMD